MLCANAWLIFSSNSGGRRMEVESFSVDTFSESAIWEVWSPFYKRYIWDWFCIWFMHLIYACRIKPCLNSQLIFNPNSDHERREVRAIFRMPIFWTFLKVFLGSSFFKSYPNTVLKHVYKAWSQNSLWKFDPNSPLASLRQVENDPTIIKHLSSN